MGFVEGKGALCALRAWFARTSLTAAGVCSMLMTASAFAQDVSADEPQGDLFAEMVGGTLGVAAGGLLGLGTGLIALQFEDCGPDEDLCGLGPGLLAFSTGALGIMLLTPGGVAIAGAQTGGRGSYWAALCGTALGFAGMFGSLATFAPHGADSPWVVGGYLVLMVTGAVIGYRVSARERVAVAVAPAFDGRGGTLAIGVRL